MSVLDVAGPRVVDVATPDTELLSLDGLARAARRLPRESVELHVGRGLASLLPDGRITPIAAEPEDAARTLDDNGGWMFLTSLARFPEYRALMLRLAAPLQLAVRASRETPVAHDLSAILAAPFANVPLHFDRRHHLLVQVEGHKTVGIAYFDDPVQRAAQIARGMQAHALNADRMPARRDQFVLRPGQALVLPAFTFHWVEGHDDVSIAAVCVIATDATERLNDEYRRAPTRR